MIDIQIRNHVAEVVLNRPEKKNAMSIELFKAIADAGEEVRDTPGVRAVILSGAGGDFCAGIDLAVFQAVAADMEANRHKLRNPPKGQAANFFQKPCTVWHEVPAPVIAAIDGVCLGAGMQLALGCDFRIAAPDARLSILEAKWGLVPDMGISQVLPGLMRADQAKELIMTAPMLSAEQALGYGLVTRVEADPLSAARAMAADLAARSPEAVQFAKELVDATYATDPDLLRMEGDMQARLMGSPNQMETVFAQMQKRQPVYN